jgi:hypothetical protein
MKQHGFFDEHDRLKELSKLGDPLERLNTYMGLGTIQGNIEQGVKKRTQGSRRPSAVRLCDDV